MLTEGPASAQQLMEGPANAQKFDRSLRKVLLTHGKLIEVDRRCSGCTKVDGSLWKVPRPHRKLMEGLADIQKVDGWNLGCT